MSPASTDTTLGVQTTSMENKINAFTTSCYRIMLNIKLLDCVTNTQIYQMTGTQSLITTVRQCQLRFFGHILRKPDDEPCRKYTLLVTTHGRRRPGRQTISYTSYIQKLLGDTSTPGTSKDLKLDRLLSQRSKRLEKNCSRLLRSRMMMSYVMITKSLNLTNIMIHCK